MIPYNSGELAVITSVLAAPTVYDAASSGQELPPAMSAGQEISLTVKASVICGIESPGDIADHYAVLAATMADIEETPTGALERSMGITWTWKAGVGFVPEK